MFFVLYMAVAAIAAVAAFLLAESVREPGETAPDRPVRVTFAAVAGLLWPVLAIGLVQWALIAALHRHLNPPRVWSERFGRIRSRHAVA